MKNECFHYSYYFRYIVSDFCAEVLGTKMADIGSNGNEDADTSFEISATAAVLLSQRVAAYGLQELKPVDEI